MNNLAFQQTENGLWRAEFVIAEPLAIQLETIKPSPVMVGARYPDMPNAGLKMIPNGAPFIIDVPKDVIVTLTVEFPVVKQVVRQIPDA